MINVSKEQLGHIEYLLTQSAQGNHVLFDLDTVRRVYRKKPVPMTKEQTTEVEQHVEKLMTLETVMKQKAYVEKLPEEILFRVVKTYFNIVENSVFETSTVRH